MKDVRPSPCGVLVVDKVRGPTSHDVVAAVRRLFRTREVGHAGTLDPMATGVLVLALGEATKLVPYLTSATKEYTARIALGRATDTLDATGTTTEDRPFDAAILRDPARDELKAACRAELARTTQEPPNYSAIHEDGERAHVRARRGETFVLPERPVRVHALDVTGTGSEEVPFVDVRVRADKGYYVRSLGRDLARRLGTVGHLTALRRVDSGGFTAAEAILLTSPVDEIQARLIPLASAARRALPSVRLLAKGVRHVGFGKRVELQDFDGQVPRGQPSAWFDEGGVLLAIGLIEDEGRVLRGFASAQPR